MELSLLSKNSSGDHQHTSGLRFLGDQVGSLDTRLDTSTVGSEMWQDLPIDIELGGHVHMEGPTDSGIWQLDDHNFRYLLRNVMHKIYTDLQYFEPRPLAKPRKRLTTIYSTHLHLKRTFHSPKTTNEDILSLEEDKGDVRYWQPAYPSNFCNQLMASLVSHHLQEQQRAREFLDNWPRAQMIDETPEFFICPRAVTILNTSDAIVVSNLCVL